ncbi:MAG: hypothetical protein IKZ72_06680 [Bacteroidales bacterium]|nr:hypothetical protein [Bacteroidales bacterium]
MKRILIMLAAVVFTATTLSAQIAPGMKYRELKGIYNPKEYFKSSVDPYSRGWSGLASAVVPGLGQLVCGEAGRGIAVFAGDFAFGVAAGVCVNKFYDYVQRDANGNIQRDADGNLVITDEKAALKWGLGLIGVAAGNAVYWVWNICDAVKVAKVKNMYYQDLQGGRAIDIDLYPSVDFAMTSNGMTPVTGMTLSMKF